MGEVTVEQARSGAEVAQARALFEEYAASLGVSLCFQGFDRELAGLPGDYAPPAGRLLLARVDGELAGCVALRPLAPDVGEMKRLFVRPRYQGLGLGRRLATAVIQEARALGYARLKLDTLPSMTAAIGLYGSLGFSDTAAYRDNPVPGARFMELSLS